MTKYKIFSSVMSVTPKHKLTANERNAIPNNSHQPAKLYHKQLTDMYSSSVLTKAPSSSMSLRKIVNYTFSNFHKNPTKANLFNKQFKEEIRRENQHLKQKQLIGDTKVDQLTQKTLLQYEGKLKLLRDKHHHLKQQIINHFNTLINDKKHQYQLLSQNTNQQAEDQLLDQIETLNQQKIHQLIHIEQKFNVQIQHLQSQYAHQITLARKQYELQYIKNYILTNTKQLQQDPKSTTQKNSQSSKKSTTFEDLINSTIAKNHNSQSYIPNNLVLKKLFFTLPNNKKSALLLAGIENNDQDHCAYLKTLIQRLKIKDVLTMLPPDLPYFIKTENSFLTEWRQFLKIPSPSVKFYLNPNPKVINDIALNSTHIPLVLYGMTKSKSFYQTTFSLMQMNEANFKYQHQPLYSGLTAGMVENVYFCDYPFLKEREMIAMNVQLQDLRQLMKRYTFYKANEKEHFSAELLLPKTVVEKKYRHIIKLAKTIALMKQQTPILICPASIAEVMAQQWQKSSAEYLQFDYTHNSYLLDMELSKKGEKETLFIEFIEKLVILDIILEPLIEKYFVKYGSFPYSCRNTVGGKENLSKVFLLWRHYFSLYSNAVKGKFTRQKDRWQEPL